jgi:hypothetical protein
MQVYAIYAPAHHKPGKIHNTAAAARGRQGRRAGPNGSVQPPTTRADQNG